jgi:hypothetical protein
MALFKTRKSMSWPRNSRTPLGTHFYMLISQTPALHLFSQSKIKYVSSNLYSLNCILILSSVILVTVVKYRSFTSSAALSFSFHKIFRNSTTHTKLLHQPPAEGKTRISWTILQYSLKSTLPYIANGYLKERLTK